MAMMSSGGAEDRLSGLPDELLHLILCMLPLKHVIRTSALSTRWTRLWHRALAAATALDFGHDFACNQSPVQLAAALSRYLDIHGGAAIDSFRVVFSPLDAFAGDIQEWVRKVVAKGVKELEVDLSHGVFMDGRGPLELPSHLFQCGGGLLAHLSLSWCHLSGPVDATSFSGLRSLSLNHAGVTDDMLQDMLPNCPVLEFLSLMNCRLLTTVKFTSARLQGLEVVKCSHVLIVEVSTPMLRSFAFHGNPYFTYNFSHAPVLQDAYVAFTDNYEFCEFDACFAWSLDFLARARIMTLSSRGLMLIVTERPLDYEAPNLQDLQLLMSSMSDQHLHCILTFIDFRTSPFLERLLFRLNSEVGDPADTSGMAEESLEAPPDAAFGHLRFVKVVNFRGTRCELRLLRFLLERATALESMVVVTLQEDGCEEGDEETENESLHLKNLRGQVSTMHKASPEARVVVCRPREDGSRNPAHMRFYHEGKYSSFTSLN